MENIKSKIIKNKKIIIVLLLVIVVLLILRIFNPIGYSLFSDKKSEEKSLKIGKVEVVLEEDPEWQENDDEYGIEKYTKSIKGVSTAEQDAYVRVRCIPIVQYFEGNEQTGEGKWITASIPQEDINVVINTEDWVKQEDYWYYTKILHGFEETGYFNVDWQILKIPSEISTYKIRTDVRVILEYSQVSNNMWKDIFKIEELPDGVEIEE